MPDSIFPERLCFFCSLFGGFYPKEFDVDRNLASQPEIGGWGERGVRRGMERVGGRAKRREGSGKVGE
jgi:hypothetical protein